MSADHLHTNGTPKKSKHGIERLKMIKKEKVKKPK